MGKSELERLERIVASLAEESRAYAVQREKDQAKLDAQLAELAEQNKAYALRLEEDRVKREEEHAKREEERIQREVKYEEDRVKREEDHAKREEERIQREVKQEEERAKHEAKYEEDRVKREEDHAKQEKEREKREAERTKREEEREKDRAKREEERAKREAKYEEERRRERAEAEKRINRLDNLFVGQWGKLMEALVEGELVTLLNQRNIPVEGLASEHKRKDSNREDYEIDLIAINGNTVVAVEVKTTLWLNEVRDFLEKLPRFTGAFREYRGRQIIGAVAYLKANEGSDKYAAKQGLYVIRAVGNGATIVNPANFKPRIF